MLNFEIIGTGHPVIFLHGFMESNTMWKKLLDFPFPFQCILIELPGHGKSENLDDQEQPSLNYYSDEVIHVIEHLQLTSFDCVGHSMGGYVALQLKNRLAYCRKVVLLNSNFWSDSIDKKRDRVRVADIVLKNKDLFIGEAIPNLYADKIQSIEDIQDLLIEAKSMSAFAISYASLAMSERTDYAQLLLNHEADFLIIQGALDKIVPVNLMLEKLNGIKINYKVIDGAGHMSHHEKTKEVASIISSFLN